MKRQILAVVAMAGLSSSVSGQNQNAFEIRLKAFENAQQVCKAIVLSNHEAALSFIRSNSGALTDKCECAAVLAVSNKSDSELREILMSEDVAPAVEFSDDVRRQFLQCMRIS